MSNESVSPGAVMMKFRCALCASFLAVATGLQAAQELAAFRRVVMPDTPLPVQRAAAEELACYVGRITGTNIGIVAAAAYSPTNEGLSFFIGAPVARDALGIDPGQWQEEEWLLRTVPNGLLIAGDDRPGDAWSVSTAAGSMLAVYTLLDDYLGVHWFWPDPFGEHVPGQPDARIPSLDIRQTPRFTIRSIQTGYSSYHTADFKEAARRWARRSRQGWVRSAVFGHSWYYAFHLNTGEEFARHPEWFALVNGKRRGPQMCTTHPEVINRMVEYVLNGRQDIMNISPSDGGSFCECNEETKSEMHKRLGIPSCTSLDIPGLLAYDGKSPQLGDRIFTYANEVARRVREKNPAKGCGMFAYALYNEPPRRIKSLEPNLYLSFAYQCASFRDPAAYRDWRDTVGGWQKLGARMVVREGWGMHYYLDLPVVHYRQILANTAEASRMGFTSIYGEGGKCFATQAPNYWALTRMMWDPTQSPRRVMNEFWTSAYGPAAAAMEAYFETYSRALDENWSKRRRIVDSNLIAFANIINSWQVLLPPATVAEAEGHLAEAEKKVPPGEYADRVAFHRFGQDYTRLMLDLLGHYQRLTDLGMKLEFFSAAAAGMAHDEAAKQTLLKEAYDLGEQREKMLLAHRDWAGPDEGLYASANDNGLRQWHGAVKTALGIRQPTALTKQGLTTR